MDSDEVGTMLRDLLDRTEYSLSHLRELSPAELNAHPGGHPNSPAWLLWHTGREIDIQLARLSGGAEVWPRHRDGLGLGEVGDTLGYGHSDEQARSVRVDDHSALVVYIRDALAAVRAHVDAAPDWGEIVDTYDGEPISRQVRVTSLLIDALEHLAQAHYIAGMPVSGLGEP